MKRFFWMREYKISYRVVAASLITLFYMIPSMAESEPPVLDTIQGEEAMLFGDIPSVFTASKYEQKITDAPARISIITGDEIQRYGHRTLVEILNTIPGFQSTNDRNYSLIGNRGLNIQGDYNARILILIDGHRVNENIFDSAVVDRGMIVNVDLIDRVEVVRGPASSLYGSSAFFGVVNVITKRGRDTQGTEFSVSAESHNGKQGRLTYGMRYDNELEILISASGYDSKGNDQLYYPEFDDPTTNNGVAQDVDDANNKNLFAKFIYGNFTLTAAYDEYEKGVPTASYGTIFNNSHTRTWEGHSYIDLKYQTLMSNGVDVTARLFYDDYWYEGNWTYDYALPGDPPDEVIFNDKTNGDWWGTEAQLSKEISEQHYLTMGFEYRNSLYEKQHQFDIYGVYLDSNTDNYTWASFLQDELRLTDELIINLGLRYDYFSSVNKNSTNPRLAVIWSPYTETNLKLLYGSAFRAPNPYEVYYQDGNTQKRSISLEPETIKTYELILEQGLDNHLNIVASLYRNNIENMIVLVTDPADNLLVFVNKNEAHVIGSEVELHGHWDNGWKGSISFCNQQAEDSVGVQLINSPRNLYKFNLIAPTVDDSFSTGIELQYESGRKTLDGNKTDSHIITNLTVFNKQWLKEMRLSASIYNLFDKRYSHPGGEEHTQDQIEQDERSFRIKFDYTF